MTMLRIGIDKCLRRLVRMFYGKDFAIMRYDLVFVGGLNELHDAFDKAHPDGKLTRNINGILVADSSYVQGYRDGDRLHPICRIV